MKNEVLKLISTVAQSNMRNIESDPDVLRYIREDRGLDTNYLVRAGCGYLTNKDKELFNSLFDNEKKEAAVEIGFITRSEHMLLDGIFFPVYTNDGQLFSYSVRLFPWSELVAKGASPHWTLRIPLAYPIGISYPDNDLQDSYIFICEGAIDTLTLLQNGYKAIGLLGVTNWNSHYLDYFIDKKIIIAFDNDANRSGQKAAVKLAGRLSKHGLYKRISILRLPDNADINSSYHEGFGKYVRQNLYKFSETKAGKKWYEMDSKKKKVNDNTNQMTEKVKSAKDKNIVSVFKSIFGNKIIYEFPRGYKTQCPFHDDARASFHIYTDTNSFFCFGCHAHGDTIDLVRKKYTDWDFNTQVLPFILEIQ